jgi:hypothetical protein
VSTDSGPRSLAVQSILYGTSEAEVVRSARALALSAQHAQAEGLLGDWVFQIGDCSPQSMVSAAGLNKVQSLVSPAGGRASYEHFDMNYGTIALRSKSRPTSSASSTPTLSLPLTRSCGNYERSRRVSAL